MADGYLSRRQFVAGGAAVALAGMFGVMTGCTAGGSGAAAGAADPQSGNGGGAGDGSSEPITFVWLPDNSSSDMTSSREAIGAAILAACGRKAELLTTTDYNVAIEAIASGKAQMALLGPEGYVQANKKNSAVQAAFTNSDEDGGLDGACYYSRICVRTEDADAYKSGSGYSIEGIKGGSFSFVSATSTSGFKVPSSGIVEEFDLDSSDVLLEAGGFFSEVLFGNSHVGSVVNLLSGDADAAAFDDVDVDMYLDLVSRRAQQRGRGVPGQGRRRGAHGHRARQAVHHHRRHAGAELAFLLQRGRHFRGGPHEDRRPLLLGRGGQRPGHLRRSRG
ncbi:MAG: PhnD/SsuA/transferrin family substrate-binding protein [Gordonibacter urolithinfaciens]